MKCPKCGYERKSTDDAPEWQCPACAVVYAKVLAAQNPSFANKVTIEKSEPAPLPEAEDDDGGQLKNLSLAARGQKIVIYSILLNFLLRSVEKTHVLPALALDALFFLVAVYSLLGVVKLCSGLQKSQNQKLVFMALSFYPVVNLVVLVYLSIKATKELREAGYNVGLLGVKS